MRGSHNRVRRIARCPACSRAFVPERSNETYCSTGCQREAEADARRQTCSTSDAELEERVGEYRPRHGVWPV